MQAKRATIVAHATETRLVVLLGLRLGAAALVVRELRHGALGA